MNIKSKWGNRYGSGVLEYKAVAKSVKKNLCNKSAQKIRDYLKTKEWKKKART